MPSNQNADRVLKVDFSWRKYSTVITEAESDVPIYLGKMSPWNLTTVFRTGPSVAKKATTDADSDADSFDEANDVIGESKVRAFHSVDCPTTIRGRPVALSAAKKILTRYNYSSTAFASDPLKPAVMTWRSNSSFKVFDFDLLDERDELVARFNSRYFGLKKVSVIEMFGPKAWDSLATEEVIITGITLWYCMVYRASSPVPLIGALVSRRGKDYNTTEKEAKEEYERNMAASSKGDWHPSDEGVDPEKMWDMVNNGVKH
jgi:hypothetical protein